MATRIRIQRSGTTGVKQNVSAPVDNGEISANTADAKLFVRNATGTPVQIAQMTRTYNASNLYSVDDLCIFNEGQGEAIYLCTTDVTAPEAFDAAKWLQIGAAGGGAPGGDDITKTPTLQTENTITIDGVNDDAGGAGDNVEGLIVDAGSVGTTSRSPTFGQRATIVADLAGAIIDENGVPSERFGNQVFLVRELTHPFTLRGQAAMFNGSNWALAVPDTEGLQYAFVREIVDADTVMLQANGAIPDPDDAVFAGGAPVDGATYFISGSVAGQLSQTAGTVPVKAGVVFNNDQFLISLSETASSTASTIVANQPAHGFVATEVGMPLYFDETDPSAPWSRAQSNAIATVGLALLGTILDVDNFEVIIGGPATVDPAVNGGVALTPGQFYFTSDTQQGRLVNVEPSEISNPMLLATETGGGILIPWRASYIDQTEPAGERVILLDSGTLYRDDGWISSNNSVFSSANGPTVAPLQLGSGEFIVGTLHARARSENRAPGASSWITSLGHTTQVQWFNGTAYVASNAASAVQLDLLTRQDDITTVTLETGPCLPFQFDETHLRADTQEWTFNLRFRPQYSPGNVEIFTVRYDWKHYRRIA